jgi:hypothetical protein
MDIKERIKAIDGEIATRKSKNFGIKVRMDLSRALIKAGKIKKAEFTVAGTGGFPMNLPAYDGQYFVFEDWEIGDDQFEVGQDA